MERNPCTKCYGKGNAKIKNDQGFEITVKCPRCNGSGYEGIYATTQYSDEADDELENEEDLEDLENNKSLNIEENINSNNIDKEKIINQIIKYPELFTEGISFYYKDENPEIFIYLKNKYMFNIKNTDVCFTITLKNEYKNKLAEMIIIKLRGNNYEI